MKSPRNTKVTNNTFVKTGKSGSMNSIEIKKYSNGITSENNIIDSNIINCPYGTAIHIELVSSKNIISSNIIDFSNDCKSDTYQYGILYNYSENSIIKNNIIDGGNLSEFWLVAAYSKNIIMNNNITQNFLNDYPSLYNTSIVGVYRKKNIRSLKFQVVKLSFSSINI